MDKITKMTVYFDEDQEVPTAVVRINMIIPNDRVRRKIENAVWNSMIDETAAQVEVVRTGTQED